MKTYIHDPVFFQKPQIVAQCNIMYTPTEHEKFSYLDTKIKIRM